LHSVVLYYVGLGFVVLRYVMFDS